MSWQQNAASQENTDVLKKIFDSDFLQKINIDNNSTLVLGAFHAI